ncbi:MAG: hypothetical protein KF764_30815 [Labilithrix sp.]|nr:hypothetical protein [Labilithrix sp.]
MRRLAWFAVLVAGAQGALACGRVLDDAEAASPAQLDGGPLDGGPLDRLDGSDLDDAAPVGDAAHDGPNEIVPTCRPIFQDGFESPTWTQDRITTWPVAAEGGGTIAIVTPGHSGTKALDFSTPDRGSTVWIERPIDGLCAVTIDFWMMRRSNPGNAVAFFELSGDGRRRTLRDLGSLLRVEAEPASDAGPPRTATSAYDVGVWHHVVVRYELDGAMTVRVDNTPPTAFEASTGPMATSSRLHIGILGGAGTSAGGNSVVFDDVLIY